MFWYLAMKKKEHDISTCATSDLFGSPSKRRKSNVRVATDEELKEICVEELYSHGIGSMSSYVLEVYVLYTGDVKFVECTTHRSKERESVHVFNNFAADRTGPIQMTFWRKLAEDVDVSL